MNSLSKQVTHLETSISGMSIHIDYLKKSEEKRKEGSSKLIMGFLGMVIATAFAWVVGGGLAGE